MNRLVLVHTTPDPMEGHLLRARLEEEDIPCMVKGEGDGPYRMGSLLLWVPEEHEVQARLILAEVASGRYALEEDVDVPEDRSADEEADVPGTDAPDG